MTIHRSVRRTDMPPPKRRRSRTRKQSISDESDDEASKPKIKQPDSPKIKELPGKMHNKTQYSNTTSVPLQSRSTNSLHNKSSQQQVEHQSMSSFNPEDNFNVVEPSKLLEQTLKRDGLWKQMGRFSEESNMDLQRQSCSTDQSTALVSASMLSDALLVANQLPESPPVLIPRCPEDLFES